MRDLQNLVTPKYAAKWKVIGTSLGLSQGSLDIIDHDYYHRAEDCCNAVWECWLDEDINPSWNKVLSAINRIQSKAVADKKSSGDLEIILPEVSSILQVMYVKKRFEVSEDDWPPYQPEVYTTVALIHHREKITSKKSVISIAKQMHKGEIALPRDTVTVQKPVIASKQDGSYLESCKYVSVIEIFPTPSSSDKAIPYTILIEGAPGIGKTVLCKEIAFLWANGTLLQHKRLVVLIFLRDPSVQKFASFNELAKYITCSCQQSNVVQTFSEYLINTSGKDLLFVLDGYDELPEVLRHESFIADIINRKILPCCDIVVTSRPAASAHLHQKVDRRVEVLGFTTEDRKKYIHQALQNDPTKIAMIFGYLQSNPFIDSLCYIPLNMTILMCLFTEATLSEFPKTQTEINNQFICMTISRYFRKKENIVLNINSLSKLPGNCKKLLRELSRLAFDLLKDDKIVFSSADVSSQSLLLPKSINGMGLLKAVKYFSFVDNREQVSFNFLHFSLQEFLAAFHIASSSTTDQEKIIRKNFWNSKYLNAWIMYCGLTGGNSIALKHYLSGNRFLWFSRYFGANGVSQGTIDDKIKCLHLFQCFLEAGNTTMCEQVGNFLYNKEVDLSGQALLLKDIHTLGFFLTRSSNKEWEVLNLSQCYMDIQGITVFVKSYLDQLNTLSVKILDLSTNDIAPSSLPDIYKLVLQLKVQKLIVMNNNLTDAIIAKELFNFTVCNKDCNFHTPLSVVNNSGKPSSITVHSSLCSIKEGLDEELYIINAGSKDLTELSNTSAFNNVHTLYVWNCNSKVSDVETLIQSNSGLKMSVFDTHLQIREINDWQKFKSSKNGFRDNVDYIFQSANALLIYGAHHSFSEIVLSRTHKFLSTLSVTNCFLTSEALANVGVVMSNNDHNWEEITLADCRIDDDGFEALCSHLSRVTTVIKVLNLSNNYLTATSIPTIIKLLHFCLIEECMISYNYISDELLRDAVLSEVFSQYSRILNFIHKQAVIVINDTKHLDAQLEDGNFCSLYFVNCQIDINILKYPMQKDFPVGSLVLANNVFLDDTLTLITTLLTKVKIAALSTVQLTGNVAGTRTSRHASTRETREGAGSPRGIASKTKTTRELNYSQFTRETSLKGPSTIMIQPVYKIHVTDHSDMQLQHICTLY